MAPAFFLATILYCRHNLDEPQPSQNITPINFAPRNPNQFNNIDIFFCEKHDGHTTCNYD